MTQTPQTSAASVQPGSAQHAATPAKGPQSTSSSQPSEPGAQTSAKPPAAASMQPMQATSSAGSAASTMAVAPTMSTMRATPTMPTTAEAGSGAPANMAGAAASGQTQQTPDEPVSCPADAMKPGEMTVQLMHDGVQRSFITFVPSTYDNTKPFPLLVNFHGAYQNSAQQRDFSRMNPVAEMKGFIVIYPQGSTSTNTWDAGDCCTQTEVDDVGFTRAAVKYMQEHVCIDKRRIYATGMSNGGRMTYRLGCEAADLFAAIAPVAGDKSFPDQKNSPGCMPARPISLIDFMGSADDGHFEYQQGQIKEWIGFNGCTDDQPKETYRNGMHACMTYSQCQAGTTVTYCIVQGGGHCWPGELSMSVGRHVH